MAAVESRPYQPFAHLAAPNVDLYRRVMLAFVAAKRRFVVHLRAEDVEAEIAADRDAATPPGSGPRALSAVPASGEMLVDALTQLVEWGNLRADPDTSRVTSVEDFHRARFLYQLTHSGEAAERSLAVFDEQLGRRGALQAVALADIAGGLRALRELAREATPDPASAHLLLRDLVTRCGELADNAQAFMGSLQRTIDLYDVEIDAFRAYKDRLIDYLERFLKDLVGIGSEITRLLDELEPARVDYVLTIVARRNAEDAAPGGGDRDSGDEDPREAAFLAELAGWRERWQGLREWFVSAPEHPSQSTLLRIRARQAIPDLLAVITMLNERRSGRSDRSADFRELAVWFAEAPDEPAMHRLWRAAFGLYSTRHLTVDADTVAARAEHPVSAGSSWAAAPPLLISPRLRRTGSYERRGRPNRVVDRAGARRRLAERAANEAEQTAAARARLATGRPIRLVEIGELDSDAFRLFLELLGDALAARRPGEREVRTTTADGSLSVALIAVADAPMVEIRTDTGILRGPDHVIEIIDLVGTMATADGEPLDAGSRLVA